MAGKSTGCDRCRLITSRTSSGACAAGIGGGAFAMGGSAGRAAPADVEEEAPGCVADLGVVGICSVTRAVDSGEREEEASDVNGAS